MRNRNITGNLEVYAVAGTHTAVLSFDYKTKPTGLLGFAIERKDIKNGKIIWLQGQKCFQSIIPNPVKGQQYPSHLHPIQSFMWKDFTLMPGNQYQYKITPVHGTPAQLRYEPFVLIEITAELEANGKHDIYFNQGVAGSQYFANNFPDVKISEMDPVNKLRALKWLSKGLFEGLQNFIADTKPGEYLYGMFYEFHELKTLVALKDAHERGVNVELVVDGKQYGKANKEVLGQLGMLRLVKKYRTKAKIPHNKFLVRCTKLNNPVAVWSGSTNISEKGIFGQCNTGHVMHENSIAKKYFDYWNILKTDPTKAPLVVEVMKMQADLLSNELPDNSATVFFSPRNSLTMLEVYAKLVEEAGEMACGIFPFNVDKLFVDAFNSPKDFPRYVIVDRSSGKFQINDTDLDIALGSYIKKSRVDQWLHERSAGKLFYSGTDFVHNKFLVIDPLGNNPVIVAGSANFSKPSTNENDENMLVLKGTAFKRESDIYLTEFIRLFDHFNFREWLNTPEAVFKPFLQETTATNGFDWFDKYFDSVEYLSYKRKMVFKNMIV